MKLTGFIRTIFYVLLAALALYATPSLAANCYVATSQGARGPADWESYCWIDFTSFNETTARSAGGQFMTMTLQDGTTLSFTLRLTNGGTVTSSVAPTWGGAEIGNTGFLGIAGRPVLYSTTSNVSSVLTFSNITLTPPAGGSTVTQYMFVAADGESTGNTGESIRFQTNGGSWSQLAAIGDPLAGSPTINGLGTQSVTLQGTIDQTLGWKDYVVGSSTPTQVIATLNGGGPQGAMFAIRFASIKLNTQITPRRLNAADQFNFQIQATSGGSVLSSGTTTGSGLGPFTSATVNSTSQIPLTLTQAMAAGSSSTLSQYRSTLTCTNSATGSSTVMPNNVTTTNYNFGTLRYGDYVTCTFTESPYPRLTLSKLMGTGGRFIDTNQFVMNIKQGATTVATTTTTGTGATVTNGTTPTYQAAPAVAYSFSEDASGTTTLVNYNATMSCANAYTGSPTTLPTVAGRSVTPTMGDVITCTITNTRKSGSVTLAMTKASTPYWDPVNLFTNPKLIPGALVTYSLNVTNSGNLAPDNNSIFLLDPLPTQVTVGTASAPTFTDGSPSSGLTFNAATDVAYSNAGTAPANFAACTYTPTSAYDTNVRYICLNPKGVLAGSAGAFTLSFRAQIK